MSRVIAVANQKGGVAKTTSVVSLGAAFARNGLRVLLVDLDAQSSLTFSLGIDPDLVETSIADVLIGESDLADTTLTADEGMRIVPATIDLAGVEAMLLPAKGREFVLRRALEPVLSSYDVILLDCSPSLGLLTLNALAAADEVIVPLQCEMLSHRGVGQLLDTVADVHRLLNPRLIVRGLLPTMYDARSVHSQAVLADVRDRFDLPVLPPIPRSVRFAEAPGVGGSILQTAPTSPGAKAYLEVADALIRTWRIRSPKPRRGAKKAAKSKPPVEVPATQQVSTAERQVSEAQPVSAPEKPAPAKPSPAKVAAAKPAPKKTVPTKSLAKATTAKLAPKKAVPKKSPAKVAAAKPAPKKTVPTKSPGTAASIEPG
jgi:chromosome partitioning protein